MMQINPFSAATSGKQSNNNHHHFGLITLLCLVAAGFALGGYWFYRQQEEMLRNAYCDDLQAIARLKTNQILTWRHERLANARMNSSGMVRTLTLQWLRTSHPATLQDIKQRLQFFLENEGYHNMILADAEGRVHLSLIPRDAELELAETSLLKKVVSSGQAILGDFYYCPTCRRIHINVAAPIFDNDRRVVAALLLITDPEQDLYPLIEAWPLSQNDDKAETLLVRRDGDNVLFLNRLRLQPHPALQYRLPLTDTTSPIVQAALGKTGIFRGKDYRDQEVIANINGIPDTEWFMVTKMDTRRMLAESRFRRVGILLLVIMGTVMVGILAQLVNIARQKTLSEALLQAERERSQTRKEIRATLYGIGDGVIATDAAGLVTRMNPEAERLTDWKEIEALGQPLVTIFQLFDEETATLLELPIHQVLGEGEFIGVSHHVILAGRNTHRWPVTISWSPIRNESGDITGAVLVFRDQTKRKAMEKARAESAKRYSDLIESINDFIWETGPDFRYSFASKRSLDLLGYPPEEFVGKAWIDILDKEVESQENIEQFKEILANHQPYHNLCRTFIRKDGRPVILESNATPTFDAQGCFLGYRGITRDITERKRAEEEQKVLQAQLLQSQKMDTVGRLAGGVAHDFNNMLTVICNYLEMALDELGENHFLYKRLFEAHQAALHSASLTRQLLVFARNQVITPKILDLNDTITGTLKMLHRLIGENIELIWKPGPDLWQVKIDPTQVGQILTNLAVNARDAIAGGKGHLIIETGNISIDQASCNVPLDCPAGKYVVITLTDDGCGMELETLSKIFEPFFTTKEEGRGTGLGLSTVYGIVKQNKGIIKVDSKPGQGTTFKVYLPRQEYVRIERTPPRRDTKNQGTETILLVEDEPSILELGAYILEQLGYTVLAARKPSEALTIALEYKGTIHLMVTDVIMPEMNGQKLAGELKPLRPETKVLFISGYTTNVIAHHGVLDSGVYLLEKPFSVDSLGQKVREVLDRG